MTFLSTYLSAKLIDYSPVAFYPVYETLSLATFILQVHIINYKINGIVCLAHIKLIASLSFISIICQFIMKEWMTCLWLELVMTGHLKTYWWCVRHAFSLKCRSELARQTPISPYSSHLLSHVFAYL